MLKYVYVNILYIIYIYTYHPELTFILAWLDPGEGALSEATGGWNYFVVPGCTGQSWKCYVKFSTIEHGIDMVPLNVSLDQNE